MEEFIEKLNTLFRTHFPASNPELEQVRPLRKVGGFLVWRGFEGVEQIDRQRQLSRVVRENLSPGEQRRVTTILTFTPREAEVIESERAIQH